MALFGEPNGLMRPGIAAAEPQNELAPRPTAADAYDTNAQAVERWLTEQQQISADRGLWQGGSVLEGGGPTGAGWVDAAGQTANALMMGTTAPGGPGFIAYHGSPHDFPPTPRNPHGEFDPAKIGTGEGAQAYGVGAAYLADREGIATGYRDVLSVAKHRIAINEARNAESAVRDEMLREAQRRGLPVKLDEGWGDLAPQFPREFEQEFAPRLSEAQKRVAEVEATTPRGHMYEVQVNADPEHFLHWDTPPRWKFCANTASPA